MYKCLLRSRAASDDGFSLIDVSVAVAVFAIIATMLAGSLSSGMRGVLTGKRREVATEEANRLLEISRSLSYDAVGLIETDSTIGPDTAIRTTNGTKEYQVGTTWEPIIWAISDATTHPFNPHKSSVSRGATDLTRYIYVTGVDTNGDGAYDMKRVVARVTWILTGAETSEVRAQTLVSSAGADPLNGSTPQKAEAKSTGANATVANGHGDLATLTNAVLPSTGVQVALPWTSGASTSQAISTATCTAQSAALSGATNDYGAHNVSVTADDDAQTATPSNPPSQSWSAVSPDPLTGVDDVDNLVTETGISSPVSCTATAEDLDGQPPADDQLPYEKGTGSVTGAGTVTMTTDLTGAGLPSNTLTALALVPQAVTQEVDHTWSGNDREVAASATNGLGTANVLKIPSVFPDGLVRVDAMAFTASVRSTDGASPSVAPAVTGPNPLTIRVYDPSSALSGCSSRSGGYCIYSVDPLGSGWTGINAHVTGSVTLNLGLTKLTFDTRVSALPPAKDPASGVTGANGEKRWSASYSPITVTTHLTVEVTVPTLQKIILTDTVVNFDAGTVSATACAGVAC